MNEKGEKYLKPFIEDFEKEVKKIICAKKGEKQNCEDVAKILKIDDYFHGSDLIRYILARIEASDENIGIKIDKDEFVVENAPIFLCDKR